MSVRARPPGRRVRVRPAAPRPTLLHTDYRRPLHTCAPRPCGPPESPPASAAPPTAPRPGPVAPSAGPGGALGRARM